MIFKKIKKFLCRLLSCNKTDKSSDEKWWILVRPNNSGEGERGIILYNETTSSIEKTLPIPPNLSSPHALDNDGKSLWVGGMGNNESLYELDPNNGSVLSEIKNIRVEGIALVKEGIWYGGGFGGALNLINRDGTPRASVNVAGNVIQDIATYGFCRLFYAVNDANDPIIELDVFNGTQNTVLDTQVSTLYTLTIKDDNFIVIGNNRIIRFDMKSGAKVLGDQLPISGWITAISPYIDKCSGKN